MAVKTAKKTAVKKSQRSLTIMPAYYFEINRRIKWIRQAKDMTFEDLANVTGVNQSTLAAIEAERTNPNIHVLRRIRKVFAVSYDWLIDGTGSKPEVQPKKSILKSMAEMETTLHEMEEKVKVMIV